MIKYFASLALTAIALLSFSTNILAQPSTGHGSTTQTPGLRQRTVDDWALVGATIVTEPGRQIDSGTVLIKGRKIIAVGKNVQVPAHARIVNLAGRTIYAGLFDAYTQQPSDVTSIQNGRGYWHDLIRPQLSVAGPSNSPPQNNDVWRKQGVTAKLIAPSSGIIKGAGAVVLTNDKALRHSIVEHPVSQHAHLTAARNGERSYPNSPMGAVALARQAFYDAEWHQQANAACDQNSLLDRPEHNQALDVLNHVRAGRVPFVVDTSNELFFLRADRFAREFNLNLIVKGSGNEYRQIDAIKKTGRAVLVPVNFPQPPNVGSVAAARLVSLESLMHWDHAPENAARLEQAEISFAFTSHGLADTGVFLGQIRKAVRRGLSKTGALRALTTTPSELFGVAKNLGTIEAGKLANLVVTTGDLFDDETKVIQTWVAGERFQFETKAARQVVGQWTLRIDKDSIKKLTLNISGETSLKGELNSSELEKPIPFDKIVLNGARLSGTFHPKELGVGGVARMAIVFETDAEAVGVGSIRWADGTTSSLAATRHVVSQSEESKATNQEPNDVASSDNKPGSKNNEKKVYNASYPVNFPLGAFGRSVAPTQIPNVLFQNATVWTNSKLGIIRNCDVLIRDGKIELIGQKLKAPENTTVVNGTGMHLTPGIIDCHSHMATDGGVNESGQAVTAEVRIEDFIDSDDINIYRQLAGGVTTSNILHGSANPIGGQNQVIKLRWGALPEDMKFAEAPAGIKFALGENVKQSNWGDEFTTRYPQTRMGVQQIFRDEFKAAIEYSKEWDTWRALEKRLKNKRVKKKKKTRAGFDRLPPRRDLELDAIAEIVKRKRWIHCHSYRQDEILALIRILDEHKIQIGTFQHILEGYKVADAMAKHGAMGSAFSDWWAYKFEVYDAIPYAGALMHNAGVVVSFNSDDRELARHLNHEAAKAVKYGGVPPKEAFKFVTLNPAKQLRIDKYVGSIEKGKHADLVLWSGSPLSNFSRCEQTWVDGKKYFDRRDDQESRALVAKMRNHLIQKILDSGEAMRAVGVGDGDPATLWPREDEFCHGHDHDH